MDILPTTAAYDEISENMRRFTATRLMEIIESLRPHLAEILSDPGGIHELEPARIAANTAVIKLQASMLRELGTLYRIHQRPHVEEEKGIPTAKVQQMLQEAEVRMEEAVAAAAVNAAALERMRVEGELQERERLSLEVARVRVADGLAVLQRRG